MKNIGSYKFYPIYFSISPCRKRQPLQMRGDFVIFAKSLK